MIMYACAVFDRKVNAYMKPQFYRSKGEAIRSWIDAVGAAGEDAVPFRRHAEDYVFVYLGTYDDALGAFTNAGLVPEILMTALDCVSISGSVN
ncbi:nonstructural protein [robinz microvirus RP_40]|nr:nonstructural protein [robinz microvirus RP_40]